MYAPQPQGFEDPLAPQVDETVRRPPPRSTAWTASITGYVQLSEGSEESEGPSVLVETLFGAAGALVVLLFVFASFLALRAACSSRRCRS